MKPSILALLLIALLALTSMVFCDEEHVAASSVSKSSSPSASTSPTPSPTVSPSSSVASNVTTPSNVTTTKLIVGSFNVNNTYDPALGTITFKYFTSTTTYVELIFTSADAPMSFVLNSTTTSPFSAAPPGKILDLFNLTILNVTSPSYSGHVAYHYSLPSGYPTDVTGVYYNAIANDWIEVPTSLVNNTASITLHSNYLFSATISRSMKSARAITKPEEYFGFVTGVTVPAPTVSPTVPTEVAVPVIPKVSAAGTSCVNLLAFAGIALLLLLVL